MEGRRRRWPQAGAPPWTAPRSHWDCWGRLRPSGASRETSLWKSEDVCPEIVAHLPRDLELTKQPIANRPSPELRRPTLRWTAGRRSPVTSSLR